MARLFRHLYAGKGFFGALHGKLGNEFFTEDTSRDRKGNRLHHRIFHEEAVPGSEKATASIPRLFVMILYFANVPSDIPAFSAVK